MGGQWPWTSVLLLAVATPSGWAGTRHGLTTYGEPCIDACQQRGFPYAWCHKKPSWNGTFLNRDYCSPEFGKTRYLETCLDNCERRDGKPFYWCHTHETNRGDWDFCSPFPGDSCQWSAWGSWGGCSATCGPGSRTRRRRIEAGTSGRVGACSGETEVAFQACDTRPCAGFGSECQWGQWSAWGQCSVTCGSGGERRRYRLLTHTSGERGERAACAKETNKESQPCPYYPCPDREAEETTTQSAGPFLAGVKRLLGEFEAPLHGVGGRVYLTPKQDKILIEDFSYDGRGPDAFFWVGTEGAPGSRKSVVLPHPFEDKFYDYRDPQVPRLAAADQEDIVLTLPSTLSAYNVKWISVWCRQFSVDFGHVILPDNNDNGHDFILDPSLVNNITAVDLPSFSQSEPTATAAVTTTFEFSEDPSSNEIEDTTEARILSVALPDLAGLSEQPRSLGGSKGGAGRVTFSIGNELSDPSPVKQQKSKYRGSGLGPGLNRSPAIAWDDQGVKVNKKTAEQDEKDVGFTVIRVESSVSTEDAEDHKVNADNDAVEEGNAAVTHGDNKENENSAEKEEEAHKEETTSEASEVSTTSPATEGDADTVTTTQAASQQTTTDEDIRSTTEVDGFAVDKLIEVTLSNIDGVSKLSTIDFRSSLRTTSIRTTSDTEEGVTRPTPGQQEEERNLSRGANSSSSTTTATTSRKSLIRNNPFRPSTEESSATTKKPFRTNLFRPKDKLQSARDRLSALFNRNTSPRAPPVSRPDSDKLFTDGFVTSTPKTRRFSIAPRFSTPRPGSPGSEEEGRGLSGQPQVSTASDEQTTASSSPKRLDIFNKIPTESDVDHDDDNVIQLPSSSLSPDQLFSLIPRVTETATVKLGEFSIPVSTVSPPKVPVSTLSPPRIPPLRTTPGGAEEEATTRAGISGAPVRATSTTKLGLTPGLTTEAAEATGVTRGLFKPSRRPGLFFPRGRPGLARSTTVSTPLTTPHLRTRKLPERIRNIFTRRRSTTSRPEQESTLVPEREEEEDSTELSDNVLADNVSPTISGPEHSDNDDEHDDTDLNDVLDNKERKKLFQSKFRPRRPSLPRRFSPSPRTNLLRPRRPLEDAEAGLTPFTTPRPQRIFVSTESDPPAQTTRGPRPTPDPVAVTTPQRMSENERFQIFTDFMKKSENMTDKDTAAEITTASGVIESNSIFNSIRNDIAETPRSSGIRGGLRNDILQNTKRKKPSGKFGVRNKSDSGRVTPTFDSSFGSSPSFFASSPTPFFGPSSPKPFFTSSRAPFFGSSTPTPQPIFRPTDPTLEIDLDDFDADFYDDGPVFVSSVSPAAFLPTVSRASVTPASVTSTPGYNPCEVTGSCGPNARCASVNSQPTCSCPSGFSGIPRNGSPDPQHGCVRTPQSCSAGNSSSVSGSCVSDHTCVRDVCLQECGTDTDCALGERCIAETGAGGREARVCIKICFYDAHCLAGEYCEDNVCRPGCRSDSNCPFGQICGRGPEDAIRECEDGCHFSNDCPIDRECRDGQCSDPCLGFSECGTGAVCVSVNHLPTCKCPDGYKELNSPYDACVPASADLTKLECLEDSDCGRGVCHLGKCRTP